MGTPHSNLKWIPLGYFQISPGGLATAVNFAGAGITIPTDSIICLIEAEAQGIRWRDDGVAPTATVGMPLAAGQMFQYTTPDFTGIQFIQQLAGAILNVAFYK